MTNINRCYGWKKSGEKPKFRFEKFTRYAGLASLPSKIDLSSQCPQVPFDQGNLGSCTANAGAGFCSVFDSKTWI